MPKYEIIHLKTDYDFIKLANEYGNDQPLLHIFQIMMANDCKTIISENPPNDLEYKAEYDHCYKNVFSKRPPEDGIGLHFFSSEVNNLSAEELNKHVGKYLGCCFLRPLFKQRISEAFIKKELVIDVKTRFVFFICEMVKEVEVNGVKFKVSGFPYMQQDGRSIACAQAALKITSEYLVSKKMIEKPFTGPEITESAKKSGERQIPTKGLDISQIRSIMEKMGVDPLSYEYELWKQEQRYFIHPEQIIYRYLESGLPVVVGIDTKGAKHALVVIGHTFNPDYWWSRGETLYYDLPTTGAAGHCSTAWIQNFIVQDDNLGPYLFVPSRFLQTNTYCIAVPLPKNIFLKGEDAELIASKQLTENNDIENYVIKYMDFLNKKFPTSSNLFGLKLFHRKLKENNIIFRTYLRKSEEFKKEFKTDNPNEELNAFYQAQEMPDYIWVVEISIPEIFCHSRKRLGEVLIDPSADSRFESCYLSIHIPGLVIEREPKTRKIRIHSILTDDNPCKHLYRKSQISDKTIEINSIKMD